MTVEVERLLVRLEAQTAQYNASLLKAQQTTNTQLAGIENRFASMTKQVRGSTSSMAMGVTGALGAIGGALGTAAVIEYANAWTRVSRSIDANSAIFGIALRDTQSLTDLANEARVDLEAYAKLYVRTSAAIRDYGFEAGTAEKVTSTLAKALKLGGAAASEQASVLLQFSQALQKGKLDGDEFRSVMENAGVVQELLAKRLNVTKGELLELAADGKLRINDLVAAMVDGAGQVDRLYQRMPATIDEAFSVLRNNVIRFIGEADQASGASQTFARGILTLSENLDKLAVVIGAVLGSATVRMVAFAAATVGAANPVSLLAAAVGALATAYVVYGDDVSLAEDKTVTLRDSVQAFAEIAGGEAKEAVATLTTQIRELASSNAEAMKSVQELTKETAFSFAGLIAQGLILQDKLSIGPSIIDGLLSLDAALGKVQDRAAQISAAKALPDFGKLIRDAEAGKLEDPSRRGNATGTAEAAKATEFSRTMKQIRERTALLEAEADVMEQTVFAQEKARAAADLRFAAAETAAKQNRAVTQAELDAIEQLSTAYAEAQVQAEFLNALQQSRETEIALRNELELVGLFGEELFRARNEQELLNAARRAGVTLTPELEAQISAQAAINASLERQIEIIDEIRQGSKEALTSFIADMRQGASATEALGNSLNRLADRLIDLAVSGLVESALGPLLGGGGGGSSGGALSGLLGFAGGGVFAPGVGARPLKRFARGGVSNQAAIFGEAGPEAAVPLPDGRRIPVDLRMGSPATAAGGGVNLTIAPVFNVENGTPEGVDKLRTEVTPQIRNLVRQEVGQIFDRQRRFTRSGL